MKKPHPLWTDIGLTYSEAVHGMQTGVAYKMQASLNGSKDTSPKHLRTGINSAMVEISALAHILMRKGVITEAEFLEELRLAMNHEVASYEAEFPGITFR